MVATMSVNLIAWDALGLQPVPKSWLVGEQTPVNCRLNTFHNDLPEFYSSYEFTGRSLCLNTNPND